MLMIVVLKKHRMRVSLRYAIQCALHIFYACAFPNPTEKVDLDCNINITSTLCDPDQLFSIGDRFALFKKMKKSPNWWKG